MSHISQRKLILYTHVLLLIEFILAIPVQLALVKMSGDVTRAGLYNAVDLISEIIGKAAAYALLAVLGIAWYYRKMPHGLVTALYAAAILSQHIAANIMAMAMQSDYAESRGAYILAIWIDVIVEAIVTAVVIIAALLLRKKRFGLLRQTVTDEAGHKLYVPTDKPMPEKLSDITQVFLAGEIAMLAVEVIGELTVTIPFLMSYSDIRPAEIVSIITAYGEYLLFSVMGFFVMRLSLYIVSDHPKKKLSPYNRHENLQHHT